MANDSYNSTYKTYKAGTTKLISWLATTARQAGMALDFLSHDTSNPRNMTSNKVVSKYQVPAKELPKMAKYIAEASPRVRVPEEIIDLAKTVISLRRQARSSFARLSKSKAGESKSADAGHRHFISLLEEVLSSLQSLADSATDPEIFVNVYCALKLRRPTGEGTAAEVRQAPEESVQYELQATELDTIFMLFAFFKDLNEIRDHIKGIWQDYRDRKLDLMAAAVTTDTALNLMKRSSEELGEAVENGSHWASVVGMLTTYLDTIGGTSQAFYDWVCAGSAQKLDAFAEVLDPGSLPVMKPGHFGVYSPKQDRSKLSNAEKEREDVIVLMELLPEFVKISRSNLSMPVQDQLTAGLMKMIETCDINALPMYTIFATEVLLDIHHTLREHAERPFRELQATGMRVVTTLDDWFRYSRSRRIVNWPQENDEVLKRVRSLAQEWTQEDLMAKTMANTLKGMGVKPRPYHLLKNHPILCGLLTFQLNVLLQEGGMKVCTAWGSLIYPAHLYNAARQSAHLEATWADIDYMISVHSPQRIFVGVPPSEPSEYLKRFLLALGASASNFARNRRPGGRALLVESKKGPRGLKTTSPVKDIFRDKYVYGKTGSAVLSTANLVAMLAVASKAERTSTPSVDLPSFTGELLAQKKYTPIQLLTIIREGLAGEELHLLFDYFSLHQRGCKLLRKLQTHVHERMVGYFGEEYIEDESQLPYLVGYVFEVVRGSDRTAEELRIDGAFRASRMLFTASEVLEEFLGEEKGALSVEMARKRSCVGGGEV